MQHCDQLQHLALANRGHVGGVCRRGLRLGARTATAHTFDGLHPADERVATIRRQFAVSRHSTRRTSALRRLGGHFTRSFLATRQNRRRPPAIRPQRAWRI